MRVGYSFGAAAGFLVAASAAAGGADLPARKSRPARQLEICAAFGPGFLRIPGSEICVKIGGRVRREFVNREAINQLKGPMLAARPAASSNANAAMYVHLRSVVPPMARQD